MAPKWIRQNVVQPGRTDRSTRELEVQMILQKQRPKWQRICEDATGSSLAAMNKSWMEY